MPDFDFGSIEDSEDEGEETVRCLIRDCTTGEYGWHHIDRETLAENGREDVAGVSHYDDDNVCVDDDEDE